MFIDAYRIVKESVWKKWGKEVSAVLAQNEC
jgi:hypothetical protein